MHQQVIDVSQRSADWMALRLGKVTATRVHSIIGTPRARDKMMKEIVDEIITGQRLEIFVSEAMEWGNKTEAQAREAYSARTGNLVEEVGFVIHQDIPQAGCSPDGYVNDDGLCELKCPTSDSHYKYLLSQDIPDRYITQVQFQMACTGRKWCDWVSFDPRVEPEDQLLIIRVERDDAFIKDCEQKVRYFLEEVNERVTIERELTNGRL